MNYAAEIEAVRAQLSEPGLSMRDKRELGEMLRQLERNEYRQRSQEEAEQTEAEQKRVWAKAVAEGEKIREQIWRTGAVALFHELWGVYHAGKPRGRAISIPWPDCVRDLITPTTAEDMNAAYDKGRKRLSK